MGKINVMMVNYFTLKNIYLSEITRKSEVMKGSDLYPRRNKNINLRHMLSNETINISEEEKQRIIKKSN